ncbi:MAG: NAD kinase [Bacteroidota bacterium]
MKIGIHGKEFGEETVIFIEHVFNVLNNQSAELVISDSFAEVLKENGIMARGQISTYNKHDDLSGLDILLTFGGDGTLLDAVTHVGKSGVPILGVNLGRLGFLATTARENFTTAMDAVFNRRYILEPRTLLNFKCTDKNLFDGFRFALNDFTILKKDTSSMIMVNAYINGEFLNSYWADGIIVSTPTGSTGYSMSCGGPLVLPNSNNFIITPVSPHNLTVRPIVVPDDSQLSFRIEGRSNNFLISLDSRFEVVDNSVELIVQKEDFVVNLIKLEDNNYFKTLRQKLNWGLDVRN